MGVHGLWRLLLPIGRRISIETLEGKVLAIDASIWLTQFLLALKDPETGQTVASAHLMGFFRRICRLRFHGIRPIFVFDGVAPEIKRRELQNRRRRREQFVIGDAALQRMARRLLAEQLQRQKAHQSSNKSTALAEGFTLGAPAANRNKMETTMPSENQVSTQIQSKDSDQLEEESINDWDNVSNEVPGNNHNDDDDTEYDDILLTSTDEITTMDYIHSLPVEQRKNAIEDAKRRQRLRSRKEFIPAAGDPLQFSKVQLTNFLRSSKLSQAIERIMTKEEQTDGMASDPRTRITLEREDNNPSLAKRKRFTHNDSSDEEDDDNLWDHSSATRQRAILESSSEEEEDTKPPARKIHKNKEINLLDGEEGGFLPTLSETQIDYSDFHSHRDELDESEKDGGFLLRGETCQSQLVNHSASESKDDKGAFKDPPLTETPTIIELKDSSDDEGGFIETSSTTREDRDTQNAQEMEDHLLAKALQEVEDDHAIDLIAKGEDKIEETTREYPANRNLPSDSEEDENIDWEDGNIEVKEHSWKRKDVQNEVEFEDDKSYQTFDRFKPDESHVEWEDSTGTKRSKISLEDETSAALERAQATASKLADWAGRVFRRVLKEADESNKASSPNKTLDNPGVRIVNIPSQSPSLQESTVHSQHFQGEKHPSPSVRAKESPTHAPHIISAKKDETRPSQDLNTGFVLSESTTAMAEEYDIQWREERKRKDRTMDTVTDEMKAEAIQLLQLFGVPYVEAPSEAEAQCAALEQIGLVDGIITEDSDVFVFGGETVYKNIFDEKMYTEVYRASDARREMGLGQNGLVALAMLLGSDYTEGIKGVGIVNAMEILQAFDVSTDLKEGLGQFRKWLDGFDPNNEVSNKAPSELSEQERFHIKHRTARTRWVAPSNFPAENVIQAYLNPVVEKSREAFSWGEPDVDNLVLFCSRNIGWSPEETQQYLKPVMKRLRDKSRQTRIDSFMRYEDSIKFADVRSKRLRVALGLKSDHDGKPKEMSKEDD